MKERIVSFVHLCVCVIVVFLIKALPSLCKCERVVSCQCVCVEVDTVSQIKQHSITMFPFRNGTSMVSCCVRLCWESSLKWFILAFVKYFTIWLHLLFLLLCFNVCSTRSKRYLSTRFDFLSAVHVHVLVSSFWVYFCALLSTLSPES